MMRSASPDLVQLQGCRQLRNMTDSASATNPAAKLDGWNTRMAVTVLFLFVLIVMPGSRLCCADDITLLWDPVLQKELSGTRSIPERKAGDIIWLKTLEM